MPSNLPPGCTSPDGIAEPDLETALETLCDAIDTPEVALALKELAPIVSKIYARGYLDGEQQSSAISESEQPSEAES